MIKHEEEKDSETTNDMEVDETRSVEQTALPVPEPAAQNEGSSAQGISNSEPAVQVRQSEIRKAQYTVQETLDTRPVAAHASAEGEPLHDQPDEQPMPEDTSSTQTTDQQQAAEVPDNEGTVNTERDVGAEGVSDSYEKASNADDLAIAEHETTVNIEKIALSGAGFKEAALVSVDSYDEEAIKLAKFITDDIIAAGKVEVEDGVFPAPEIDTGADFEDTARVSVESYDEEALKLAKFITGDIIAAGKAEVENGVSPTPIETASVETGVDESQEADKEVGALPDTTNAPVVAPEQETTYTKAAKNEIDTHPDSAAGEPSIDNVTTTRILSQDVNTEVELSTKNKDYPEAEETASAKHSGEKVQVLPITDRRKEFILEERIAHGAAADVTNMSQSILEDDSAIEMHELHKNVAGEDESDAASMAKLETTASTEQSGVPGVNRDGVLVNVDGYDEDVLKLAKLIASDVICAGKADVQDGVFPQPKYRPPNESESATAGFRPYSETPQMSENPTPSPDTPQTDAETEEPHEIIMPCTGDWHQKTVADLIKMGVPDIRIPRCIDWGECEIKGWLRSLSIPQYTEALLNNQICGRTLCLLTASNLPKMGVTDWDHIKIITASVRHLLSIEEYVLYDQSWEKPPPGDMTRALYLQQAWHSGKPAPSSQNYLQFLKDYGFLDVLVEITNKPIVEMPQREENPLYTEICIASSNA